MKSGLTVFAKRLSESRKKRGLSQAKLAKMASITPQTLSAYEKATITTTGKNPSLANAVSLANALQVSLDWLCGTENRTGKEPVTFKDFVMMVLPLCDDSYKKYVTLSTFNSEAGDRCVGLLFQDPAIRDFLLRWSRYSKVFGDDNFDSEVFDCWLKSKFKEFDSLTLEIGTIGEGLEGH